MRSLRGSSVSTHSGTRRARSRDAAQFVAFGAGSAAPEPDAASTSSHHLERSVPHLLNVKVKRARQLGCRVTPYFDTDDPDLEARARDDAVRVGCRGWW